jgi:hypothetical protein
MLCGRSAGITAREEAADIVATFLSRAQLVEGHTIYETGADRYLAAEALERPIGNDGQPTERPRCLVDRNTGEYIAGVSDMQEVARKQVGSLSRNWLDARMAALGWKRKTLQGHRENGRAGKLGAHKRRDVYVGFLVGNDGDAT